MVDDNSNSNPPSDDEFLDEDMQVDLDEPDFLYESMEMDVPETNYTILQFDDIVKEQRELIDKIAELFSVKTGSAKQLLTFSKWNADRLIERYYGGEAAQLFKDCGIVDPNAQIKKNTSIEKVECSICYLPYKISEMKCLYCEHNFCVDCWKQYLHVKINDGYVRVITCPARDCDLQLDEDVVESILCGHENKEVLKKYHRLIAQSYIEDNKNMRWCPGKGCDKAVRVKLLKEKEINCDCGTKFCFGCGSLPHAPADCRMYKEFITKCQMEGEDSKWMASFTKECPKCNYVIHKEGGCQYMTCTNCQHKFCWVCLGNFDHKSHSCNKFKEEAGLDPNSERAKINKFIHFYTRFNAHEQSSKLEDKLLKVADEVMEKLSNEGQSWIDVQYVKQATLSLMEARNMLKYTYIFGFYLPDHVNRDVFEYLQSDLEKGTEKLSELLESNKEKNRIDIINNSEYVKQRIKALLQGLSENDIIGGGARSEKNYAAVEGVEKYEGWIYNAN
jgi:ariadne-1